MSDNPLILQYSDGQLVPYQVPDPAQAAQRALDFTGIPDMVSGANALARGEYLPGLGQAAAGASAMLPLGKLAGAAKLGAELMPLAGMVKAWHGTPHLFEPVEHNPFGEFRDAAIGTGEGAQVYGHGHYVAGNPAVAGEYQKNLAGDYQISQDANGWSAFRRWPHPDPEKDVSPIFQSKDEAQNWVNSQGSLLEVHILPDEHELLDWDARLADQPPGIRKVIDRIHSENENLRIKNSGPDVTGEKFYRNLTYHVWDKTWDGVGQDAVMASRHLHEAGIPGIKYLDQGSRASGAGTSNYVIFDPKNLRIVGRNGQRLEPVEEDPFK